MKSPFRMTSGSPVFRGKAELLTDRVAFTGWTLRGRFRSEILLKEIEALEWWTSVPRTPNMRFSMKDGSQHILWLASPGLWSAQLGNRLDAGVMRGRIPEEKNPVRSAA
jgi:hypothetical protein